MFKFLFVLILSSLCYGAKELPSDIEKCKPADVQCIAKVASQLIRAYGKTGREDMGIPAFEPFQVENIDLLDNGRSDRPVNLQLTLNDIVIHGLSGINVERMVGFEKDPKSSKFEIYTVAPNLKVVGLYKSDGRVLAVPVKGEGKFTLDLENVQIGIKFKPKVVEREGKQYLDIDKFKLLIDPKNAKIHLDRYIEDSNPLGDSINQVLNENWQDFWKEINPPINNAILKIMKNIISEPLKIYSYNDIYLNGE